MSKEIYLDGNATTCVLPAAVDAAVQAMRDCFGNPSSTHATGLKAKAMMDIVRQCARRLLGVGAGRIMFNSGATEGIQTAVLSALCALRERRERGETTGGLLVYGATEHKAVPEALAHWNRLLGLGLELKKLPVDGDGRHDLAALRALAPQAAFVCTMAANNETGVVSDLPGIAAALDGSQALWMVDCVQGLGKLSLDLGHTRIDYAPFSGHKLYAPKGIGMLYVREGAPYTPLVMGGGQEAGLRSGTENMAGIAALGAVLAALEEGGTFRTPAELHGFREKLAASLRAALPGIVFNAPFEKALPTTLNFSVPGLSSKELLDVFDAANVRVSAGSACSASKAAPSYVLDAMGLPAWRSSSAVRMSFGPLASEEMINEACARIERCGKALRDAGLLDTPVSGASAPEGVLQLSLAGNHTWLLLDAPSHQCIAIDLQAELAERVDSLLRSHGYQLLARLSTRDGASWTADTASLAFGAQSLRRVALDADQQAYLLCSGDRVAYAFTGMAALRDLAGAVPADALLCTGREELNACCTSLRAEAQGGVAGADLSLDSVALARLLEAQPQAVLVDVRESYEQAACIPGGRAAQSVPLSRLAAFVPGWLGAAEQPPLVFFCRSGNRSAKAAQCMRRLGYRNAFSLGGGIALAAPGLALAA
ncbi:aminotransferase class V-fold PLP-dependent enzyme [Pseudoduganella eburnea]|uniref:cysteine desulfurase n=1 Tax=Massilia eburnea TaxID=1776165 RepID=A0A6L6QBY0_9BURK|nr:aminotransferase class V-fold PLP-dependent enzyme [Massilia eburnea]MTW09720.1 aminotransferase class V-fold PLP-dependent enzyme [Massilia eburnea]